MAARFLSSFPCRSRGSTPSTAGPSLRLPHGLGHVLASTTNTQSHPEENLERTDGSKNATDKSKSRKSILILSLGADAAPLTVPRHLFLHGKSSLSRWIPNTYKVTMLQLRSEKPDENGCIKVECLVVFI